MRRAPAGRLSLTRRDVAAGIASLAFSGVASPAVFAAADGLASGQFRDEVVEVLRRNRPNLRLELSPDPAVLTVDQGRVYLGNLYQNCTGATHQEREARILQFFDAMASALGGMNVGTFETVRTRLRARIVSAEAVANSADEKLILLTRPFSEKARIAYVIDSPQSMAFVSKGMLDKWAVAPDAVHATAVANLDDISRNVSIEPLAPHPGSGLYVAIQGPDGYVAARLLAPKFMERMGDELGPEHFVSAPHRDLLMAWSVDCSAKRQLAALATQYASISAYRVTDEILVWSADGVRSANAAELADHGRV
jgi:uncharacterized protein YtpQ (UPF0354 family)